MKKLAIVYHSQSGYTERLAQAVFNGANSDGEVAVNCFRAQEANCDIFLDYDAVIFGSAENFGYLSGGMKDFFDRTFYPVEPKQVNLPYAVFISAGNDGSGAVRQLERIVTAYPLKKVAEPVIVKGEISAQAIQQCEELGATIAAGLSIGMF